MRKLPVVLLAAFCAILALAGFGWGFSQQRKLSAQRFAQRRLALLEADNERLRSVIAAQQREKALAENVDQRGQIEKAVTAIRELNFLRPVTYDVLTRTAIQQTIGQKLNEQFSDEEFKNIGIGLSALGLLPRDYPLKQKYVELLGEQVAAFYDQHQHKLFMFEDALLANAQNRVVLAHELTHALQDQHFSLLKLPLEIKNNDDRAGAASALIEGDATLVMSQYMLQNATLINLRDNLFGALSQNMKQLQEAPRYLREMLIFPYLRGQEFCAALLARGGWSALDAAYKNPPSSTTQILHPEKYLAEPREEPIAIDFGDTIVNGEKPLADNVLGEMGTRLFLSQWIDGPAAERAASGWRGDRYLVFRNGDALVWTTQWNSEEDALEFFDAAEKALAKRYGAIFSTAKTVPHEMDSGAPRALRLIQSSATEVVLIDARDEKLAQGLAEKFSTARAVGR